MSGIIEWAIFLPLALLAIVTAAGMIITMSMYRAGLALMASFVALAGLFILLDADLLAAIQVMMNVGGMLVMVLFMAMMMIDPGGEMMWDMKRDMHMSGPGAFSMHMPSGPPPPEEEEQQKTQNQESTSQTYTCPMHPDVQQDHPGSCPRCGMTLIQSQISDESKSASFTCPMHPEVQQDHPGNCPKCGMTLIEQKSGKQSEKPEMMPMEGHMSDDMTMSHGSEPGHPQGDAPPIGRATAPSSMGGASPCGCPEDSLQKNEPHPDMHDMAGMDMSNHDMSGMDMEGTDTGGMDMEGMTPRQNYDMMVDMAMSTAQLPWAIGIGAITAVLLIVLLILTPWPLASTIPTQDASRVVGELLLSRYMIAFEGAALLILAGIAGAVLLAKREHPSTKHLETKQPEQRNDDKRIYTCPMHPEVQQQGAGKCPKCGMALIPAQETVVTSTPKGGQS